MRYVNFLTFHRLGRMPQVLLALGLLALVLAAGGATAKPAEASESTEYDILVMFDSVRWTAIDDGVFDGDAEVFGLLTARNLTGASPVIVRQLGDRLNPARCSSGWTGLGPCKKDVVTGTTFQFSQTPLALSAASGLPASAYFPNSHGGSLKWRPQDTIRIALDLKDYDAGSANDPICSPSRDFTFTETQLQQLNVSRTLTFSNAHGTCEVGIRLKRFLAL